jgi:hypothetical protein
MKSDAWAISIQNYDLLQAMYEGRSFKDMAQFQNIRFIKSRQNYHISSTNNWMTYEPIDDSATIQTHPKDGES